MDRHSAIITAVRRTLAYSALEGTAHDSNMAAPVFLLRPVHRVEVGVIIWDSVSRHRSSPAEYPITIAVNRDPCCLSVHISVRVRVISRVLVRIGRDGAVLLSSRMTLSGVFIALGIAR